MADPKDPYYDKNVSGALEQAYARVQSVSFHCPYCDVTLIERGNFVWHSRHWPMQNILKCSGCQKELKIPDFMEFFHITSRNKK